MAVSIPRISKWWRCVFHSIFFDALYLWDTNLSHRAINGTIFRQWMSRRVESHALYEGKSLIFFAVMINSFFVTRALDTAWYFVHLWLWFITISLLHIRCIISFLECKKFFHGVDAINGGTPQPLRQAAKLQKHSLQKPWTVETTVRTHLCWLSGSLTRLLSTNGLQYWELILIWQTPTLLPFLMQVLNQSQRKNIGSKLIIINFVLKKIQTTEFWKKKQFKTWI